MFAAFLSSCEFRCESLYAGIFFMAAITEMVLRWGFAHMDIYYTNLLPYRYVMPSDMSDKTIVLLTAWNSQYDVHVRL